MSEMEREAMTKRKAFTLVELLVVIGIIALLISVLMPALNKAQRSAQSVQCKSNMRMIGQHLIMYANENNGHIIPLGPNPDDPKYATDPKATVGRLGGRVAEKYRWPTVVLKPPQWNHPVLRCPADPEPGWEHSYVLNRHLEDKDIRYHRTRGVSASEIIVLGEKKSEYLDYHMDPGQFDYLVEKYRHGLMLGSNYLFLDGHVDTRMPEHARSGLDPWDPAPPPNTGEPDPNRPPD
jgi:prepilin-type N-terminal cleavage/methylation domain-containing protein/prepilin-type processing-associated H-X9-DG protein